MEINILHLSDIHIETKSEASIYLSQLEADLIKELGITILHYLVISGDIGNKSLETEYLAACELIDGLISRFSLNKEQVVIVPGNHDINWDISEDAYYFVKNSILPDHLPRGKYVEAGNVGILLRDDALYKKRFDNFSRYLYERIYSHRYPMEYDKQGIIFSNEHDKILFLSLNSCWGIDHHEQYRSRSSINMNALSNSLKSIIDEQYNDWLKIAVWHHPVIGSESISNNELLEQLSVHAFQICMHGHIHQAQKSFYDYDPKRKIHIIGAGTFGAPVKEQVSGIPLQYNLLKYDLNQKLITIETRKKERAGVTS